MKSITVSTSDNKIISLPMQFINTSGVLRDLASDLGDDSSEIPLINIHSNELIQLKQLLQEAAQVEINTDLPIEEKYISLSDLIKAANYLEIIPLIDLLSKEFANLLKSSTLQELEILEKKI